MLRKLRVICVLSVALMLAGCACSYPPIFGQGAPYQNYNLGRFDPYPDRQAGPPLDGVRPPGAIHQRSEPVRSQAPYSNSSRGAVLVP
jgi:hypothetical protein